jgi:hypothetical protein
MVRVILYYGLTRAWPTMKPVTGRMRALAPGCMHYSRTLAGGCCEPSGSRMVPLYLCLSGDTAVKISQDSYVQLLKQEASDAGEGRTLPTACAMVVAAASCC